MHFRLGIHLRLLRGLLSTLYKILKDTVPQVCSRLSYLLRNPLRLLPFLIGVAKHFQ